MFAVAGKWPGKVELVEIPEPEPKQYEVKIKTEVSTLCNATDRKLIEGHFPGIDKYPLILGHESVGKVVSVGEKVKNFKKGDRLIGGLMLNPPDPDYSSGWGGFSEYNLAADKAKLPNRFPLNQQCYSVLGEKSMQASVILI